MPLIHRPGGGAAGAVGVGAAAVPDAAGALGAGVAAVPDAAGAGGAGVAVCAKVGAAV